MRWSFGAGAAAMNGNHVINSIKFCVNRVSRARQQAFNKTFVRRLYEHISFTKCHRESFVCSPGVSAHAAFERRSLMLMFGYEQVLSLIASGRRLLQIVIICILLCSPQHLSDSSPPFSCALFTSSYETESCSCGGLVNVLTHGGAIVWEKIHYCIFSGRSHSTMKMFESAWSERRYFLPLPWMR